MNVIAQALPEFVKRDPLVFFFAFLTLFAFTIPICEEIAIALVGVSARSLEIGFASVAAVALAALLIQDCIFFVLARLLGPRLVRRKFLSRLLDPARIEAAERYFIRRGPVIVFVSRLVVGLRLPAILGSGFLRMRWSRFFLYDSIAAAIMTPAWLLVGYALGTHFDASSGTLARVLAIVGPVAVLVGAALVYRGVKADIRRADSEGGEALPGPGAER